MTTQINNIIEIASNLVINGEATIENAIELALQKDNEMILKSIEDIADMKRGYVNSENKTQKAYDIIMKSVYTKLS